MKQISEHIKQGFFKPVYLLYGEERYLRRQYRERLQKALTSEGDTMNTHFYHGKDIPVGEIIDLAETLPFLAERRVIFINNSGLFKSGGEKMAEYLPEMSESTCIIFTESEVDKRSKLFKAVQSKGYAAEFAIQDENTLKRWIAGMLAKENKKITESTVQLFLTKTGTDMENIQMELEKLICYCMDKEVVTDADVEAICTTRITNHIFDMINAIADKKQREALELYYDLLALKEPPMRILYLIARQYNQMLQVKEEVDAGRGVQEISSKLGMQSFIVKNYLESTRQYTAEELLRRVRVCTETEEAVKTGRIGDALSVELLIIEFSSRKW